MKGMNIGLGIGALCGLGVVVWYNILRPLDRMIALSQELEAEKGRPGTLYRDLTVPSDIPVAESLQLLALAIGSASNGPRMDLSQEPPEAIEVRTPSASSTLSQDR